MSYFISLSKSVYITLSPLKRNLPFSDTLWSSDWQVSHDSRGKKRLTWKTHIIYYLRQLNVIRKATDISASANDLHWDPGSSYWSAKPSSDQCGLLHSGCDLWTCIRAAGTLSRMHSWLFAFVPDRGDVFVSSQCVSESCYNSSQFLIVYHIFVIPDFF